ncbi:MAG: aminotransferase class III-fold pyridoxal phosphate-dependent enzyme [Planctomycetota bacterium]|jgi:4-aminobutyrate aminotransferase-like enzyme/CMP-N-acetylneuraminic acid synthetase
MIYCFDIDGTLCTNTDGSYAAAEPFPEVVAQVNALGAAGHRVILYTARGSGTGIDWRGLTERQLKSWGVHYDELHLGKPTADIYVDDKGIHVDDWREQTERTEQPLALVTAQTVAIIPARAGSKGIANKNIKPLGGYPLLAYTVVAASLCDEIDRVVVSTDSEEYAEIARRFGAEVPFLRPAALAGDASRDIDFVRHALDWFDQHEGQLPELLVHLRPTTPLRDPAQIGAAIRTLRAEGHATSLRSAHTLQEPVQKMLMLEDGFLVELFPDDPRPGASNLPRQSFPPSYHPNGYVDVLRTSFVRGGRDLHGPRILAFTTPDTREVDRPEDFEYLEYLLRTQGSVLHRHLVERFPHYPSNREPSSAHRFAHEPVAVPHVETLHRRIRTALPVAEDAKVFAQLEQHESRAMHGQLPIVWDSATDFQVRDRWGNCWIDFTSTIFVANSGHANPAVKAAIGSMLEQDLLHSYTYPTRIRARYLQRLIEFVPSQFEKAFLLSSGTEAAECGIKLMRLYGHARGKRRGGIVAFEGAMHGRTMGAQMLGGTAAARAWIGYRDPDMHHLPFPYPWCIGKAGPGTARSGRALARAHIRSLIDRGLDPDRDLCGIAIEPFLGWGAIFYPTDYIQKLVEFARAHDLLVLCDEIQAGFGRTGKLFAYQHYDVEPDLLLCGKGMSGSLPLSAVLGSREVMDLPATGAMSSTHSANPLCCAAGLANLESLDADNLVAEAARKGEILLTGLHRIKRRHGEVISHVLGKGMVAALLFHDAQTGAPLCDLASQVCELAMQRGLLLVHTGRESIKIGPPLTISDAALREGLDVLEESLAELLVTAAGRC